MLRGIRWELDFTVSDVRMATIVNRVDCLWHAIATELAGRITKQSIEYKICEHPNVRSVLLELALEIAEELDAGNGLNAMLYANEDDGRSLNSD